MREELLATHQCRAVLQHLSCESTASKLSAKPLHVSLHICTLSGFAQFPCYACNYSSLTDLLGFPHLLYNSVCDLFLPVLGQAVCMGLAVSFSHKILLVFIALTPSYTSPHANLEAENGGRVHILLLQKLAGDQIQRYVLQHKLCPGRLHQRTGDLSGFRLNLSLRCSESPW